MADNVVNFRKPKEVMPVGWRKHVEALTQIRTEIDALRKRLKQEMRDFSDVMKEDGSAIANPSITPREQQAIGTASWHLDRNVRDALTLLECAAERVGYAMPDRWCFECSA